MLYVGCSTKEAIKMLHRGAPKFSEKETFALALYVNSGKSK